MRFSYGQTSPAGLAAIERQLVDEALADVLDAAGIPRPAGPTRELARRDTHAVIGPTGIGVDVTRGVSGVGLYSVNDVRRIFAIPAGEAIVSGVNVPIVSHADWERALRGDRSIAPASDQEAQP